MRPTKLMILSFAMVGSTCLLSDKVLAKVPTIAPQSDLLVAAKGTSVYKTPEPIALGQKLLSNGQPIKALDIFKQYIQGHVEDSEGYFWLGTALNELGDSKSSVEAFAKAIALNSQTGKDSAQLRVNFGNSLLNLNRIDEALFQYHKAVSLDPNEPRAYLNLARAQIGKETPVTAQAALVNLTKAEALGLKSSDVPRYRSMAYIILAENDKAALELTKYLETLPNGKQENSLRKVIKETIQDLKATTKGQGEEHVIVPAAQRRYTLNNEIAYAILDIDETANVITIGSEDNRDPDDGAQDGKNDGIFQMSANDFAKETAVHPGQIGQKP